MADNIKKTKHTYDKNLLLLKEIKAGNEKAIDELVENNLPLVSSLSKKFINRGYDYDDIFQIGSLGLLKAAKNFDISFDTKFSTYAVPMIIGEIKRFLRDDGIIKVSRNLKTISRKVSYAREDLSKKLSRAPTIDEISKEVGIEKEEILLALEGTAGLSYLYDTIHQDDGAPVLLIDKISNSQSSDNVSECLNGIMLKDVINEMDAENRQVIMLRYYKDKTQSEVAKLLGISQVQVSRIEKRILKKMRKYFDESKD